MLNVFLCNMVQKIFHISAWIQHFLTFQFSFVFSMQMIFKAHFKYMRVSWPQVWVFMCLDSWLPLLEDFSQTNKISFMFSTKLLSPNTSSYVVSIIMWYFMCLVRPHIHRKILTHMTPENVFFQTFFKRSIQKSFLK